MSKHCDQEAEIKVDWARTQDAKTTPLCHCTKLDT